MFLYLVREQINPAAFIKKEKALIVSIRLQRLRLGLDLGLVCVCVCAYKFLFKLNKRKTFERVKV